MTQQANITLENDGFVVIDKFARYILKGTKLYLEIDLPKDLSEIKHEDFLSSTGRTYRVYSNSTNRKFIKNDKYKNVQIQINAYLSVKDAMKL